MIAYSAYIKLDGGCHILIVILTIIGKMKKGIICTLKSVELVIKETDELLLFSAWQKKHRWLWLQRGTRMTKLSPSLIILRPELRKKLFRRKNYTVIKETNIV